MKIVLSDSSKLIKRILLDVEFKWKVYGENIFGSDNIHVAWDEGNDILYVFDEPIAEDVPKEKIGSGDFDKLMNRLNEY